MTYLKDGQEYLQPATVGAAGELCLRERAHAAACRSRRRTRTGSRTTTARSAGTISATTRAAVSRRCFPRSEHRGTACRRRASAVDDWADDNFDHSGLDFIGGGNMYVYSDRRPIAAANMSTFGKAPQWGSAWKAFIKTERRSLERRLPAEDDAALRGQLSRSRSGVKDPLGLPVCRITAEFKDNERKIAAFIQDKMVQWFEAAGAIAIEKAKRRRDGTVDARVRRHAHGRQPRDERRRPLGLLARGAEPRAFSARRSWARAVREIRR